ncbi:MAG: hypothetical protein KKG59_06630 [Nanoarchaeota archaeon]|nr:hypothetical protein [Nanoarchaeota archaeon]
MRVTDPHKYIMYAASIVFILSIFIPVQGYSIELVQGRALLIAGLGLFVWAFESIANDMVNQMSKEKQKDSVEGIKICGNFIIAFRIIYIILALAVINKA